ncbi:MAG: radical SAM protein, partial [Bacteroidota bacterium]|nr:radical SAM protein [Bacteroidota bacterium]
MSKVLLIFPPYTKQEPAENEKSVDELKREASDAWLTVMAQKYGKDSVYCNILPTDQMSMSMGILSLSSYLKKDGIDVSYIHCDYFLDEKKFDWHELLEFIAQESKSADICGFYSTTNNIIKILEIARYVKQTCPNITNIIGGPHATFCDIEILSENSFIDYVVRGEGEETLYEIVKSIGQNNENNNLIPGATYRKNGEIVRAPDRQQIDYTAIPSVDFDILPKDYKFNLLTMYSRGCPFSCNFCAEGGLWGSKVRFRDPNIVAEELKMINEQNSQQIIHLADSEIDAFPEKFDLLLDAIESKNLNCQFSVNIRPDSFKRMNKERLRRMKRLGFSVFFIGVESASDEVLKAMNRRTTFSDFLNTIKLINECEEDFVILPYVMLGFPGETEVTLQQTVNAFIKLLDEGKIDYLFPKIFIPYPGCDVFSNPEKYNVKISTDYDQYARYSLIPPFEDPNLSNDLRGEYLSLFYSRIIKSLNS